MNQTNVTLEDINKVINITSGDPTEFLLNINQQVYSGWFFFILMVILGFILFRKAQEKNDQPVINIMYISTALTIISFFMRALYLVKYGLVYAMLSDFQMWLFPLIAAISAAIVKYDS